MVAFQPQADPHPVRGSRLWPGIGQPWVSLAHQGSNLLEMEISSQFLEMCQRSGVGPRMGGQNGRVAGWPRRPGESLERRLGPPTHSALYIGGAYRRRPPRFPQLERQ